MNHGWWLRQLAGDPSIVGQQVWLNGTPFTVVGVTERGFAGSADTPPAIWVTLANYHVVYGGPPLHRLSSTTVNILGRVASGVSTAQAETEGSALPRWRQVQTAWNLPSRPPNLPAGCHAIAIARALLGKR